MIWQHAVVVFHMLQYHLGQSNARDRGLKGSFEGTVTKVAQQFTLPLDMIASSSRLN